MATKMFVDTNFDIFSWLSFMFISFRRACIVLISASLSPLVAPTMPTLIAATSLPSPVLDFE
jgi:hypothetical protein